VASKVLAAQKLQIEDNLDTADSLVSDKLIEQNNS
jgi:hypothetical protein